MVFSQYTVYRPDYLPPVAPDFLFFLIGVLRPQSELVKAI